MSVSLLDAPTLFAPGTAGDGDGYPRPQLRRVAWTGLDGPWAFAIDEEGRWTTPDDARWDATIEVPYAPETRASGVGRPAWYRACWYRRAFQAPNDLGDGERLLLHFGAVDYAATVWVNGRLVGRHEGGYTPFAFDVTSALHEMGDQEVVVRAEDDPSDLEKPRGKQTWDPAPRGIWYPRTTGIWQPVWIERLPATAIAALDWRGDTRHWEIGLGVALDGARREGLRLSVQLVVGETGDERLLADDSYAVLGDETRVARRIALAHPGEGGGRRALLWSPESPTLIRAQIRLCGPDGEQIDEVESYTALRDVQVDGDRFLLNGRPYPLRLVLDQGYWPETGLTAPDDAALRRDVELAKAMGFNGVRKHQKLEDPRYLHWADRLGLLVWEEMPSAQRFSPKAIARLTREWAEAVERDRNHPCVVVWVPFNESWGVPDLPFDPAQRAYVRGVADLTRALDPSRPVVANDGWEGLAGDLVGIHDYSADPSRLTARYEALRPGGSPLVAERPGGRRIVLQPETVAGENTHAAGPVVLSEFGGIALAAPGAPADAWGYSSAGDAAALGERYAALLGAVRSLGLAGFCYTQFADTYQETNGLLRQDRTPKVPLAVLAEATKGATPAPADAAEPVDEAAEAIPAGTPVPAVEAKVKAVRIGGNGALRRAGA